MALNTIPFRANDRNHSAVVSEKTWPEDLVGSDHLVVERDGKSYVIAITSDGFEAFPVAEPNECEGHPGGPFDPMGETVYCDGSCKAVA